MNFNHAELLELCPNVFACLDAVASDNGMRLNEPIDLGGVDIVFLEEEASKLEGEEEFMVMAGGEETERQELIASKNLYFLDRFLAEAFDGFLTNAIFARE